LIETFALILVTANSQVEEYVIAGNEDAVRDSKIVEITDLIDRAVPE
jgi:hypothetical protein